MQATAAGAELGSYRLQGVLHQTQRSTVYRAIGADGKAVVIKAPTAENPTPREIARYQRAYELARHADARAVVRHLELLRQGASVALVMEDTGAQPLSSLIPQTGLRLARWLELAVGLATALGRLHGSGVVHKDLNPGNIIVQPDTAEVRLIDLGIAIRLRRGSLDALPREQIEGTLAYMSPEQCGLVSSPTDHRSDLYSLGVTLFEMATGHLPFPFLAPAELAHAHVARAPPDLRDLRKDFPALIGTMVERLLAKNADERYASAQGLAHDLERCLAELRRSGAVRAFALGQADASSSFRIPDRLYGREAERTRMLEAVGRTAHDVRVLVTVAGTSGIGKTSLVGDVARSFTANGGRVGSGKFDQFGSEQPYLGLLKAMRGLLKRELAEPQEKLAVRRTALTNALGIHGQLLNAALPELELIIGPQPEVEDAAPRDAQRRLQGVVARFLAVFATPEQPLMLFLDDLQWADTPSMQLIESFATAPGLDHLVIVAGYRSNEVGPGHPLRAVLQALGAAATVKVAIDLAPLERSDVEQLLADTLHAQSSEVQALAAHVHGVSAGNPFFVGEFLHALHERGFFHYDEQRRAWAWDLARLHEHGLPDNVATLITERLQDLPPTCVDLLDTASCVGSEFDLRTLASVHDASESAVAAGLASAVQSGVIVPMDEHYTVYESLEGWPLREADAAELGTVRYRFQHDRVRQTVHERLDDGRRAQRHLRIGRLLIRNLAPADLERRVVEVFMHVVDGVDLLDDPDERARLAAVGLAAGLRAQRALAFESALRMLNVATNLLSTSGWTRDYPTAIGLHLARAQCTYALGLADEFESASKTVIERARSIVHSAEGHGLRIRMLHSQNRYAEAVDVGIAVASSLGVRLSRRPGLPQVLWGVLKTLGVQRGRDPLVFGGMGEAGREETRAAVSLLCSVANAAYFAEPNLLPLIGMICTRLSIRHGMTPQSPYGFAIWALVLCGVLGRIDNGYRYGALALEIGKRYGGADEARARFVVDVFVRHWKEPLHEVAQLLQSDWARNRDSGDAESATYCAGVLLYTEFLAGGLLDAHERHADPIRYLVSSEQTQVKDCFLAWAQVYDALRQPELPPDLEGSWFSHALRMPAFEHARNGVQIAIGSVAAGVLDFFAGRHDRAEQRFALAAQWEDRIVGQVLVPGLAFFRALNAYRRISLGLSGPDGQRAKRLATQQRRRLQRWAPFAPVNLAHRVELLDAEDAAMRGHAADAMLKLHSTIERASGGALMYQAMAQQRLAVLLQAEGSTRSAGFAAAQAADSFRRWGAPSLALGAAMPSMLRGTTMPRSTSDAGEHLAGSDIESLCSAMATISSEIDERTLLQRSMPTLMQAAGADRGLLLLESQGQLWIEVEATLDETVVRRSPLDTASTLSRRAVELALRTPQPVVIQDAPAAEMLQGEMYAQHMGVAAILAISIALQGRTIGVLYLENQTVRGAFTQRRVEVTQALGAQVGIALENARLYGRVQSALAEQTLQADANRRFVPREFLSGLGVTSIVDVRLNEAIECEMNVLFVDLRGFTALSMALGPRGTIAMINRYLSHVQPGIAAHGGFVGQYYGDGLLALFPHDADDALRAATAMCRGLEGYNRERGSEFPELQFGMGLHSGLLTLGTIGDPDHVQCGVVGDSVNLASRMEGLTKHFGATLIVSDTTHARVRSPADFGLRPLGRVEVAGRAAPLEVFECLASHPDEVFERIAAGHATWLRGMDAYRSGRWEEAMSAFEACSQACEQDQVASTFARRCRERAGMGMTWDGIERPAKR